MERKVQKNPFAVKSYKAYEAEPSDFFGGGNYLAKQ